MATLLGSLLVSLRLDSAQFVNGSRKAQKEAATLSSKMKLVGAGLAGAFAGFATGAVLGSLQSAITGAFELASSMTEAASRIGVTVEALQELRLAAQETGVSNETLESSIARLNVQLGDLQAGSKKTVAAFEVLGLSAEDLKGKTPQEALGIIADKLAAIEDPTLRAAAAQDIFGKSYAALIPLIEGGSAALDEFAKKSREQGQISTEEAAKLDKLADDWENLKTRITIATAGIIAGIADYLDWTTKIDTAWAKMTDSVARKAAELTVKVVTAIRNLVVGVRSWITGTLDKVWAGAKAGIDAVAAKFQWLYDVVIGHSWIPDMVDGIAAEMQRLDAVMVKPVTAATTATENAFRTMAGNVQDLLDRLFPEVRRMLDYRGDLALIASSGLSSEMQAEARRRRGVEFGGGGEMPEPDFGGVGPIAEVDLPDLQDRLERIGDTLGGLKDRWIDFKEAGAYAFREISHQITGVLVGAQSLSDALRNIIGQLAEMALSMVFRSIGASAFGIPAFAGGTRFAPGGMALVGERGPELVNLPRGSQVIPNHDLRGTGGPVFNITVNGAMSDRDARRTGHQIASAASQRMAQARRAGVAG